jgi:hypothetical protein
MEVGEIESGTTMGTFARAASASGVFEARRTLSWRTDCGSASATREGECSGSGPGFCSRPSGGRSASSTGASGIEIETEGYFEVAWPWGSCIVCGELINDGVRTLSSERA